MTLSETVCVTLRFFCRVLGGEQVPAFDVEIVVVEVAIEVEVVPGPYKLFRGSNTR